LALKLNFTPPTIKRNKMFDAKTKRALIVEPSDNHEDLIYDSSDVRSILESMGYVAMDGGGDFFRSAALYRGGSNPSSLSINKKTGRFVDFAAQKSGNLKDLISLTVGSDPQNTEKFLKELGSFQKETRIRPNIIEIKKTKVYDESMLSNLIPDYSYYLSRKISVAVQKRFQLGIAKQHQMANRVVMNLRNDQGQITGFYGRWNSDDVPKNVLKHKIVGDKQNFLFPLMAKKAIMYSREVILVESPSDVLSLYEAGIENCICLFGIKMFPMQIKNLIKWGTKTIFISLNKDGTHNEYAGQRATEVIGKKLSGLFSRIEGVQPPLNDWNEVLKAETPSYLRDFWRQKLTIPE